MTWQVEVYVRNVAAHLEIQTQPEPSAILEFTPLASNDDNDNGDEDI